MDLTPSTPPRLSPGPAPACSKPGLRQLAFRLPASSRPAALPSPERRGGERRSVCAKGGVETRPCHSIRIGQYFAQLPARDNSATLPVKRKVGLFPGGIQREQSQPIFSETALKIIFYRILSLTKDLPQSVYGQTPSAEKTGKQADGGMRYIYHYLKRPI